MHRFGRMNLAMKRVMNEVEKWDEQAKKTDGFELVRVNDNNLLDFIGTIPGAEGTLYEGGEYSFTLNLSAYPFGPPSIKFLTKIWHPNISHTDGTFCDMFENGWAPAITIEMTFRYIQALLSAPNMDKPLDGIVAGQFMGNHRLFERTARFWNNKYGKRVLRSGFEYDEMLEESVEEMSMLGLYEDRSILALSEADWNLDEAVVLYQKHKDY